MTIDTPLNGSPNDLVENLDHWVKTGETPLQERLSELELQLENAGWIRQIDLAGSGEFSLTGLKTIARLARTFYLKNPLIQRGVNVSTDYVFGRGITITAKDEDINTVIQEFLDDTKNQVEITSHQALLQKERELQLDGNLFLVFFIHDLTGRVRIRSIPFAEIAEISCNPDDAKEPWYYKRVWTDYTSNDGQTEITEHTAYYRDWQYTDNVAAPKDGFAKGVVFHIKMGGFSDWRFGVSEVYAALDWARAYRMFLENWATLMAAYARFAMMINTKGGAAGVQSARTKLQTAINGSSVLDSNPPPNTASTFISDKDLVALDVVKTAGATTKAEEGRRLLLMVAAAMGLPETFFGDVSVGTLATAESLDRPTELKFANRQEFWQSNLLRIIWFVIKHAVAAPRGALRGAMKIITNDYGEDELEIPDDVEKEITANFPEILGISIKDHVAAIISGVTLDGKSRVLLDQRMVTKMILEALGDDDVDAKLEALDADGAFDEPDPVEPIITPIGIPVDPSKPIKKPAIKEGSLPAIMGQLIEAMERYSKHG